MTLSLTKKNEKVLLAGKDREEMTRLLDLQVPQSHACKMGTLLPTLLGSYELAAQMHTGVTLFVPCLAPGQASVSKCLVHAFIARG